MRNLNNTPLTHTHQLAGSEEVWILQSDESVASVGDIVELTNRIGIVNGIGFDVASARPYITQVLMCPANVEDSSMWLTATLKAQLSMTFGKFLGVEHE